MSCMRAYTDNWLDPEVVANTSVTSSAAGYPESNLYDNRRNKKWRSTSASAQRIVWDLGIPSNPKGFAAIADRNIALKISPAATIKLQGNSTNIWGAPEFEMVVPFHDFVLALENTAGLHTGPLRYWSLYIDDPTNPYGYVELGEVFLGDWIELARGCAIYPFTNRLTDAANVFTSEGGQRYGSKKYKTQEFQVEWRSLTRADIEELEDIFNYFGKHTPFFMSFDSSESFSTDKETWVRFVRFNNDSDFSLTSFNNFGMSWQLREEL